jgi:uncharacterized protein (DUF433 family)
MTLTFTSPPVPLRTDDDGVVRIGGTRVTLDTIVMAFSEGATAEEIAQQYPVALVDVYAAISFYLARKVEVDAYLREREQEADRVRETNERRFDPQGVRDRLVARKYPSDIAKK